MEIIHERFLIMLIIIFQKSQEWHSLKQDEDIRTKQRENEKKNVFIIKDMAKYYKDILKENKKKKKKKKNKH